MKKFIYLLSLCALLTGCNYVSETVRIPVKIDRFYYSPAYVEWRQQTSTIQFGDEIKNISTQIPVQIPEKYTVVYYSEQFGKIRREIPATTYKELENMFNEGNINNTIYIMHTVTHKKDKPLHIKDDKSLFPITY